MSARVLVARQWPAKIAFCVALAFGRRIPVLEVRTLVRNGAPFAHTALKW